MKDITKTRSEAILSGDRYYLGLPCKMGHKEGVRFVVDRDCVSCRKLRYKVKEYEGITMDEYVHKKDIKQKLEDLLESKRLRGDLSY